MTAIILINPVKLDAGNLATEFYSPSSPPAGGTEFLEGLIGEWWNWWVGLPLDTAQHWPGCLKGDGGRTSNNESVVFLGTGAFAGDTNPNAKNQKCEISSDQLLYLTVYPGECSTLPTPGEGEIPDKKTPEELLKCAIDSNAGLSEQVMVDGKDVTSSIVSQSTSRPFAYVVLSDDNPFEYRAPIVGGNNTAMAENYYLFFKPLPVGNHVIELQYSRKLPSQPQAFEEGSAKWDIKVVP